MPNTVRKLALATGILASLTLSSSAVQSQAGVTPPPASESDFGPGVGDVAPDFAVTGATRYGILRNPVRLSDFRGKTVVLAFFFQARTKG